jgi:hypothetical protein
MAIQLTKSIVIDQPADNPSATVYKLSLVVPGRRDRGGIQKLDNEPQVGDIVRLDDNKYQILELVELMPARNNCVYLQASCQLIEKPVFSSLISLYASHTWLYDAQIDLSTLEQASKGILMHQLVAFGGTFIPLA